MCGPVLCIDGNRNAHSIIKTSTPCVSLFLLCSGPQLLNAAYHVEVTFQSGSSVTKLFWEQIKQVGRGTPALVGTSWCHPGGSDLWPLTSGLLLLPDHPQDHVRQPSRHHPGVEAQSGPRRHREPERRQTGQEHLLAVPDPTEQLPRGLRRLAAPGKITPSLIGGEEFGGSTKPDSFLPRRVSLVSPIPVLNTFCVHASLKLLVI